MARLVLSEAERDAVTAAVAAAEARTDGEIVTIVTQRSDAYHDVALHYAVIAVLAMTAIGAVAPGIFTPFDRGWEEADLGRDLLALLIVQALAFLAVRYALAWTPLRLALTPRGTKARRVRRRAVELFRVGTESRTAGHEGVLLYLSTDEHVAEIVTDAAVHRAVPPERWGEAMAALVTAVRDGRAGDGMVAAVTAIGAILAEHFPKTADNPNELPDRVIEL
ncbi:MULTISPECIES: TPM domain-containing protein [Sphingomonas]|jgi:putative membrane protein|uniref:TPM domain-containing protein n=1 Tax=Sphingomonas TaxID=13687 RepID=UPI00082B1CC9|nr:MULTISPECIES: TPM domain-containing protein [Sphingomonas]MBY0303027.1 TPM domain-containing protein [Sphingomonas ginsenosidimutans]